MTLRFSHSLIVAALMVCTLIDGSGQDARFYGRRADHEFLTAGKPADALKLYQRAYQATSDPIFRYRFLNNIGACQLLLYRYQDAKQTLVRVLKAAAAVGDDQILGSASGNLAALYAQTDDLIPAETYAREALQAYSRTRRPADRSRTLITLGDILNRRKLVRQGEEAYRSAIDVATTVHDWRSIFTGWLHYGQLLLESGRLNEADRAFALSSVALHKSGHLENGEDTLIWNLSRLRLRQKEFVKALGLANYAIRISPEMGGHIPAWRLYQTRAEVELAMGRTEAALQDARTALHWARILRAGVVPDNDNRVGLDGLLDDVFSVLIEAGNQVYWKTRDPQLLRETFEAVEENRASSLEALLPTTNNWRAGLATPEYRYKLSQVLLQQRIALRRPSPPAQARLDKLQTELSQMEADAGATFQSPARTVLEHVRSNLPHDSALLSFRLGDRTSWLWAVDHGRLQLYRLPRKPLLLEQIRDFQAAIAGNDIRRITKVGHQLYRDLLGGTQRSFSQASQWFISLDESLYTVAFPALVAEVGNNGPVYLTQRKTLQILPGAQLLGVPDRRSLRHSRFLLAGDGIYNRADPRYRKSGLMRPASWGMARLPGSGAEVRLAADLWRQAVLLTGRSLTKNILLKEIDRDPDVIHIASHIIENQDRRQSGIVALGIDRSGEPEILTSQEIQMHPVHARLVVMTGCSSGSAEALPASGLMGLTRAWLAAGAGEVLATRWPTRDESADGLLASFYRHLLHSGDGNIPAALRTARLQMIAHGGWRAEPRYWSSFFLIGVR